MNIAMEREAILGIRDYGGRDQGAIGPIIRVKILERGTGFSAN